MQFTHIWKNPHNVIFVCLKNPDAILWEITACALPTGPIRSDRGFFSLKKKIRFRLHGVKSHNCAKKLQFVEMSSLSSISPCYYCNNGGTSDIAASSIPFPTRQFRWFFLSSRVCTMSPYKCGSIFFLVGEANKVHFLAHKWPLTYQMYCCITSLDVNSSNLVHSVY